MPVLSGLVDRAGIDRRWVDALRRKRDQKRPQTRRPSRPSSKEPAQSRAVDADDLWKKLRQGARNVAGVTWQIAVTVHLLLASRVGERSFVRLTPEGLEDVDCASADGVLTFVQVKEKGAGAGRMTATDIAQALAHAVIAKETTEDSLVVIVTDGGLGSQLEFTGWESTVAETCPPLAIEALREGLCKQGLASEDIPRLLSSTRIIQLPWNLRASSELLLREHLQVHPAVASLVVGELYAHLGAMAAAQRSTTLRTSRSIDLSDVDTLLGRMQSTVDVTGLDAAVQAGVCAPADFTADTEIRLDQFYLGVDGAPAHIAARLDVLRPKEMAQMIDAVGEERYALLTGPSGSGKSVLLWRAARDAVLGSRVLRAHRISSDADIELLVRHVQLARPSSISPVIVVADNLGRPHMDRWPDAVDRLRELPSVVLFGACRSEDFRPRLARGAARIIRPQLDRATADNIAARLAQTELSQAMSPAEAFQRSDGLLMEFLALLLKGKRLSLIIAEQAASLAEPGRELQRSAARLIAVAHSLGISLHGRALAEVLAPEASPQTVGDALSILHGEHIVTVDGDSWRGLHELRSRTLADALHESPPPSFGDSLCAVSRCLALTEASWLLRRTAERYPRWVPDVARALADHIAQPELDNAHEMAEVLEGAERADNLLYARECLPLIQAHCPSELSLSDAAMFVFGIRYQGMFRDADMDPFRTIVQKLRPITSTIPERTDVALAIVSSKLTPSLIASLLSESGLEAKVRVLEALSGVLRLRDQDVRRIFDSTPVPHDRASAAQWARLVETLFTHVSADSARKVFGTIASRAEVIARAEPWAIATEADQDGPSVTLLEALTVEAVADELPWEPSRTISNDNAEAIAIATAKRLAFACPDASVVKVRTVTPSGRPAELDGHEYARREIPTESFPNRVGVRRNVGFTAAVRKLSAAETWTEMLTAQIQLGSTLTTLAASARARLNPHDNLRRRAEWTAEVNEAKRNATLLKPEPRNLDPGLPSSHAKADDRERESDSTSGALDKTAQALSVIISNPNRASVAMTLDDAVRKLTEARRQGMVILPGLGEPIPEKLITETARLADLTAAAHEAPARLANLRLQDERAVGQFVDEVAVERRRLQKQFVESALGGVAGYETYVFSDPMPDRVIVSDTAILVTVPADSWMDAVEIVSQLDEEFRERLDAKVILARTVNNVPSGGGLQLRRFGSTNVLPAPHEAIAAFADAAGIQVSLGMAADQAQQLINELVRVSWLIALRRFRPSSWETVSGLRPPGHLVLTELTPEQLALPGVADAVDLLTTQVSDELRGQTDTSLAGVVVDSQAGTIDASARSLGILSAIATLVTRTDLLAARAD